MSSIEYNKSNNKPTKQDIADIRSRLVFLRDSSKKLVTPMIVFYCGAMFLSFYLGMNEIIALVMALGVIQCSFGMDIYDYFKEEFRAIKYEDMEDKKLKESNANKESSDE